MSSVIVPASEESARALLASDALPLLVDFGASWCAPCNALSPVLEAFAAERSGTFNVLKIDIDDFPTLAREVGIQSVPTLMVVKEGAVLAARAGLLRKHELAAFVDAALG